MEIEQPASPNFFKCPFNPYHKFYDERKYTKHVARCKERLGKSMYHCQYFNLHIFTSKEDLLAHEATCDNKPVKLEEELHGIGAGSKERTPSVTYCKFNYEHSFRSLAKRSVHEQLCPNRKIDVNTLVVT